MGLRECDDRWLLRNIGVRHHLGVSSVKLQGLRSSCTACTAAPLARATGRPPTS